MRLSRSKGRKKSSSLSDSLAESFVDIPEDDLTFFPSTSPSKVDLKNPFFTNKPNVTFEDDKKQSAAISLDESAIDFPDPRPSQDSSDNPFVNLDEGVTQIPLTITLSNIRVYGFTHENPLFSGTKKTKTKLQIVFQVGNKVDWKNMETTPSESGFNPIFKGPIVLNTLYLRNLETRLSLCFLVEAKQKFTRGVIKSIPELGLGLGSGGKVKFPLSTVKVKKGEMLESLAEIDDVQSHVEFDITIDERTIANDEERELVEAKAEGTYAFKEFSSKSWCRKENLTSGISSLMDQAMTWVNLMKDLIEEVQFLQNVIPGGGDTYLLRVTVTYKKSKPEKRALNKRTRSKSIGKKKVDI